MPMQAATPRDDADKAEWRRWFRDQLRDAPRAPTDAIRIREHLATEFARRAPSNIAFFAAMPDEPDLLDLIETRPEHGWFLPRIDDEHLRFHHVRHAPDLVSGTLGIREPDADTEITDPIELDVILCPGLGFGRDGSRLGRGRGFYDRALARCRPDIEIIGIGFDLQLVDRLPTEPHDRYLDRILTPRGWFIPRSGTSG